MKKKNPVDVLESQEAVWFMHAECDSVQRGLRWVVSSAETIGTRAKPNVQMMFLHSDTSRDP